MATAKTILQQSAEVEEKKHKPKPKPTNKACKRLYSYQSCTPLNSFKWKWLDIVLR